MIDLHFRSTSEFAFNNIGISLGFLEPSEDEDGNPVVRWKPGVTIDVIAPGSVVHKAAVLGAPDVDGNIVVITPAVTDPNIHYNVRLDDTFDGNLIKRNFQQGTAKTVASVRRPGVNHSWFSRSFGPQGEVWLIDPPPETPARIWLGDVAPAVSRG